MGCRVGSRGGQVGVFPGDTLSRFIWAGPQAKDLQESLRTAAPLFSLGHFWEVWGGWSLPEEDRVCKRKPVTFTCSGHSEWICGELQSGPVGTRRPGQLSQTVWKKRSWIFEMLVIFCDFFSHSKQIITFAPTFII